MNGNYLTCGGHRVYTARMPVSLYAPGDHIYARRFGNRTFGWYVIDRLVSNADAHEIGAAYAFYGHRRNSNSGASHFMAFSEIRRHDTRYRYTDDR